jgi:lipid-binding SYLF domain-containing protein
MLRRMVLVTMTLLLAGTPAVLGAEEADLDPAVKAQLKRESIDEMARTALERLVSENDRARELYDSAAGYAVFDSFKAAFLLSGGGGVGVAADKSDGTRTYMKMGTAGVGLGIGGQSYQVIFLFDNDDALNRFVNKGWKADAAANAVAGTTGKNVDASFSNGLAVFQLTNKGLMAQADISGTKYWKHKKLNR